MAGPVARQPATCALDPGVIPEECAAVHQTQVGRCAVGEADRHQDHDPNRDLERTGRQDHQSGTGLSARTVRYVHTILKAALREAVAQGLIATNPADKAKPPAARDAKAPEIHPWTAGELSAFLSWVDDHGCSDAVAYRLLAYTGMRRGELLALRWRDLDTDTADSASAIRSEL